MLALTLQLRENKFPHLDGEGGAGGVLAGHRGSHAVVARRAAVDRGVRVRHALMLREQRLHVVRRVGKRPAQQPQALCHAWGRIRAAWHRCINAQTIKNIGAAPLADSDAQLSNCQYKWMLRTQMYIAEVFGMK